MQRGRSFIEKRDIMCIFSHKSLPLYMMKFNVQVIEIRSGLQMVTLFYMHLASGGL